MTEHAHLSASGAYRWLACPGSPTLAASVPAPPAGPFAAEGTAAHHMLEKYFRNEVKLSSWSTVKGVEVDKAMIAAVEMCVSFAEGVLYSSKGATLEAEQRVNLDQVAPDMFGTADLVIDAPFETLTIIDYKHGAGVNVEATDNPQLAYYALGVLAKYGQDYERLNLIIIQPRIRAGFEKVKLWQVDDIDQFVRDWTAKFKAGKQRCDAQKDTYVTGKHCQFCAGAAVCPQLYKEALEVAKMEFDGPKTLPRFPEPETQEIDRIAFILDHMDAVRGYLNRVSGFAIQMLESGAEIPGYKLVARRQNRKWRSERNTEKFLRSKGVLDIHETKLKSPYQIESVIASKKTIEEIQDYIATPDQNATIAPESDTRPAINALSDFDIIEDEDDNFEL